MLRASAGSRNRNPETHEKKGTDAVSLFRSASPWFSAEIHTPTYEALQWSKFGVHKTRQKPPPTDRMHFTSGQLQLLTNNYGPRNRGTLLVGCMTTWGAQASSRWAARSDPRGVFVSSNLRAETPKKATEIAEIIKFTRGSLIR